MSRESYSDDGDEEFPGQWELYQANLVRSKRGKRGRAALTELRDALLALPRKRLIAGRLAADGDVCTIGALLLIRDSRALGSIDAAQAKLEAISAVCRCGHRATEHDELGQCPPCIRWAAVKRMVSEQLTGRKGHRPTVDQIRRPWSEAQWPEAPEYGHRRCSGYVAAPPAPADDEDDDDSSDQAGLTRVLALAAGVPRAIAWELVADNDDVDFGYGAMTPEERYAAVLESVERDLATAAR